MNKEILPDTVHNAAYVKADKYVLASFYEFDNFMFTEGGQAKEMTNGFFNFLLFLVLPLIMLWSLAYRDTRKNERYFD